MQPSPSPAPSAAGGIGATRADEPLTGVEVIEGAGLRTRRHPRHVEGLPLFAAPWSVDSYANVAGDVVHCVRSAEGFVIIQPGEQNEAFCRAIVRSRNEATVADDIAYERAISERALAGAREEVDRVRAHFHAEISRILDTNRSLQDAIVKARKSGRVDDLPKWCQGSES
jgi:hypothetical protein